MRKKIIEKNEIDLGVMNMVPIVPALKTNEVILRLP